jgi:hypothetical protein
MRSIDEVTRIVLPIRTHQNDKTNLDDFPHELLRHSELVFRVEDLDNLTAEIESGVVGLLVMP